MSRPTVCAVLCAAGTGSRADFARNKLLVPFQGSTALEKSLHAFDFPAIDEIVVTAAESDFEEISRLCAPYPRTSVVLGGQDRSHSVYNALKTTQSDIVLIHDGARPFVTRESIERCLDSVKKTGSGVCAIPCLDTIAVTNGEKIIQVPPRNELRQLQTPQGFYREKILYAYEQAFEKQDAAYTDDSSIFARFCEQPTLCEGSRNNAKLTYAEDFFPTARCGFGVDTHAFGKAQNYVVLAGVKIPAKSGLIAHSDGDVLAHAVMDAILSAAGLKDIGHYFPDDNPTFKDANSMNLLEKVVAMTANEGYRVQNLSVAIQAERPKLANYIDDMKASLSNALQIPIHAVGITAGTNEGLGYVGEGKGITVHAYVLLRNA